RQLLISRVRLDYRVFLSRCSISFICFPRGSILFFFFKDTATTDIYTLSLHDALPILALSGSPLASTGHNQPEREKASCVKRSAMCILQPEGHVVCKLFYWRQLRTRLPKLASPLPAGRVGRGGDARGRFPQ